MNTKKKLTMRSNKEHSKQVENNKLEEKTTLSSKLDGIIGSVELPIDFDEEMELRTYLENKHF